MSNFFSFLFKKKKKIQYITKLIDPALPLLGEGSGGAIGSLIGYFTAGPAGGIVGGIAGAGTGAVGKKIVVDQFARIGEEFRQRRYGKRESARIGVAAVHAMTRIKQNLEKNMQLRTDGFFSYNSITDRSDYDEILEGILIAAKNEHEEKKLYYYGNLVANIAFHPEIDRIYSNYLLRISERLSYNQICMLTLFQRGSDYHLSSDIKELRKNIDPNQIATLRELEEMKILKLVASKSGDYLMGGGPEGNITPAKIELSDTGNTLYTMMNLDEINDSEIDRLAAILSDPT